MPGPNAGGRAAIAPASWAESKPIWGGWRSYGGGEEAVGGRGVSLEGVKPPPHHQIFSPTVVKAA